MIDALNSLQLVTALKSAAEPTRLRILVLLAAGELNVKDLTQILGQSQPRISRHLKLLAESGLIERFRDGSWVYFHFSDRSLGGKLARKLLASVDMADPILRRDSERAEALKRDREQSAQAFFAKHAADWDRIRNLYISEARVEAAIVATLGTRPLNLFVDLGTGTGRMLEVFAGLYERGLGLDVNQSMLAYARSRLKTAGLRNSEVRHGDLYNIALPDQVADAVVMHQVLHYMSEPAHAVREAARILAPSGRLLLVDFAPHNIESLRETQAHERLGFTHDQVNEWMLDAGLTPVQTTDLTSDQSDDSEALTVSVWLAERQVLASARAKPHDETSNRQTEWIKE